MTAVADTSPLNYLVLIDEIDFLPAIFEKILVPQGVLQELVHPKTSLKVRRWVDHLPVWLEVHTVTSIASEALVGLDPGERQVIQLALERNISTVLIDEAEGRRQAQSHHLGARGTLGIQERGPRLVGRIFARR
jgi:predicted nucleic acid-binding protein